MRLAHPLIPYITEEIWQRVAPHAGVTGDSIMLQPFPVADESKVDKKAEADIEWLKAVITGIRNIRGEMDISPAKALPIFFKNGNSEDQRCLDENRLLLTSLAKLEKIEWLNADDEAPVSATQLVGDMELLVPMAGLIDTDAEIARLGKEISKLEQEVKRISGKLGNQNFVAKAPAEVVAKEQGKLDDSENALQKLQEKLEVIKTL